MTGLRVRYTGVAPKISVPLILRLSAQCRWLWTGDDAVEAAGALPAETAESSLDADSSLLNELIQCIEVGGVGAEPGRAHHETHRAGRAAGLRGSARHRLDAVGIWSVPRRLPTALVAEGGVGMPVCEKC